MILLAIRIVNSIYTNKVVCIYYSCFFVNNSEIN